METSNGSIKPHKHRHGRKEPIRSADHCLSLAHGGYSRHAVYNCPHLAVLQRGPAVRLDLIGSHIPLGVVLSALIVVRLFWRIFFGERHPVSLPNGQRVAANLVHGVIYCLLLIQITLGYLLGC
jgi:hypothetical protein